MIFPDTKDPKVRVVKVRSMETKGQISKVEKIKETISSLSTKKISYVTIAVYKHNTHKT